MSDPVPRKHPEAQCELCPLYECQMVPTYVPQGGANEVNGNKVAFVGEAPGFREAKVGRPFVGRSGQLLQLSLAEYGKSKDDYLLTNAVLCHPEGNETPSPAALMACQPRLEKELEENDIDLVVGLGKQANISLLDDPNIKIFSVRVGPSRRVEDKPYRVVPTIHPAYVLRQPSAFDTFYNDLGKAVGPPRPVWEPPVYKVFDDPRIAFKALDQLQRMPSQYLVMDIESPIEKDAHEAHPDSLLCIGFAYKHGSSIVIGKNAVASAAVRSKIADVLRHHKVVCQNGKYDLGTLYRMGLGRFSLAFDTMFASYALNETGRHGLKENAQDILGAPRWEELVDWSTPFDDPDELDRLYQYNAIDCANTWDWMQWQLEQMDEDDHRVVEMLCRWSDRLMVIESEGIYIDLEALDALDDDLTARMKELRKKFLQYVPSLKELEEHEMEAVRDAARLIARNGTYNPNSVQQTRGLLTYMRRASVTTTDKDMLARFAAIAPNPLAAFSKDMLLWRELAKRYGTYVKGTKERLSPDGRIRTTFKIHRTETGRFSSANPNVQNIPRQGGVRNIYAASPGFVIVYADYSNIEGRIVCVLAEDEDMRLVLMDPDRDIHGEMASDVFGPEYNYEERNKAKSIVHGKNYARTPEGIASDPALGLSLPEATKISNAYDRKYPGVPRWHQSIWDAVIERQETLITPFGRKRRFSLITNDNKHDIYKEALAFKPQSIGSDICAEAGMQLFDYGLKVRIFIHDGIIVEVHEADVDDVAHYMKGVMEETAVRTFTDYVPFPVEVEVGPSWGQLEHYL